jgi:hypothetical protein
MWRVKKNMRQYEREAMQVSSLSCVNEHVLGQVRINKYTIMCS